MAKTYPKCSRVNYQKKSKPEKEPLLSVIIPVYNAKEYLERCVDSVCGQSYKNLEILLIDDGSTDGGEVLCDKLAEKDSRIIVIHKENGGVSTARNVGLEQAKGELLAFVDSDDWLDDSMYKTLYTLMWEQDADIACCNYRRILGEQTVDSSDNKMQVYYGKEILDAYVAGKENCPLLPAIWNRLYRKDLFDDLRFPLLKKYEDHVVSTQIFAKVKKVVMTNCSYYNYNMRTNSLSHEAMNKEDMATYICASQMKNKIMDAQLSAKSKERNYFEYYCILLTMYCKLAGDVANASGRKLLKKEMARIKKEVRIAIWNKPNIGMKDKLYLEVSTYTPKGYVFLNKLLQKRK